MTVKTYWNEFGLLRARTWENDQNGLLRLAYYHLFSGYAAIEHPEITLKNACKAMGLMNDHDGRWAQHPETKWDLDRASHDEMTAILYFIVQAKHKWFETEALKEIRIGYYLKYIQVIFFILAIKHHSKICLNIAAFIIYMGVRVKEKIKSGRWDTDSELLALIKIETIEKEFGYMPMKEMIMNKIKKHWGDKYEKALIDDMLWYAREHPLREIFSEG